jgi:hypothetical protein
LPFKYVYLIENFHLFCIKPQQRRVWTERHVARSSFLPAPLDIPQNDLNFLLSRYTFLSTLQYHVFSPSPSLSERWTCAVLPLFFVAGWLMIPLLHFEGDDTKTYYLFVFGYIMIYAFWIHVTVLMFLHRYILPGLHLAIRGASLILVLGLIAAYLYAIKNVWHVEKNPWVRLRPCSLFSSVSDMIFISFSH